MFQHNHKSKEHTKEKCERENHDKQLGRFKSIVIENIFVNFVEVNHVSYSAGVWVDTVVVKNFLLYSLIVRFNSLFLFLNL